MTTAFTTEASSGLSGPAWLVDRRTRSTGRFADLPLPTADEEVWRYSRINDLDLGAFRPAVAPEGAAAPVSVDADVCIDVVNGFVVGTTGAVDGVTVTHGADVVDGSIGRVFTGQDAIASLHDGFAQPIVVAVAAGVDAGTIVVSHTLTGTGIASFPRLVVDLGAAASATVIELFTSDDGAHNLVVPVTELQVGRDARLRHANIQLLGDAVWQLGQLSSSIDAGGSLSAGTAAFGGDYVRLRVDTELAGRGAHGEILAAYFGGDTQHLDFRTFQDHAAPDTTSNLLFKGALSGKAASVYTGLAKIRPAGRGSQAYQTNRNLKLSEDAWAESVPNLEIENNEVQCSHASTVSPVDAEQRFYLESRGVPTERAERLIVRGFFDEVLRALALEGFEGIVRDRLDQELEGSMA